MAEDEMNDAVAGRVCAWLVCDPRPPVPLGPKAQVTIGRSKDCDLVLKDKLISRLQGVVKVDPETGRLHYQDGQSSNGSQLNGKDIDEADLKAGDVLTLGPFEVRVQAVLAWLCSGLMPPLPLGVKNSLTIGRSKECDVVIRDPGMSRNQGTIEIDEDVIIFVDGGSSNGTYVNGQRVQGSIALQVGDVLNFGPYEVKLRSNEDMNAESSLDQEMTKPLSVAVVTGLISDTPLPQILQNLNFDRRTGSLRILVGREQGLVVFDGGQPVHAIFKALKDDAAIMEMLMLSEGRFTLVPDADDSNGQRTMRTQLTTLLLQHSRRQDEEARDDERVETTKVNRSDLEDE